MFASGRAVPGPVESHEAAPTVSGGRHGQDLSVQYGQQRLTGRGGLVYIYMDLCLELCHKVIWIYPGCNLSRLLYMY